MNQNLTIPVTSLLPTFSDVLLAENSLAIIHKITGGLRPSRIRVEINDKLAKVIFKLSDKGTDDLLNGDTFCIVEKRSKKFGEITTAYKILNSAGYQVLRPFSMFDRFVLAVCISEWLAGNRYTTVAIIYRALTGKIGRSDAKPSVTQRKAIIESLEILMSRIIDYGAEDICQIMGYNNGYRLIYRSQYVRFFFLYMKKHLAISFYLNGALCLQSGHRRKSGAFFFCGMKTV